MFRYLSVLVALMIFFGGCTSYPDVNRERLMSLPQQYTQFDAVIGWEVRDAGSETVIDGLFQNRRYAYMDDIAIWVEAHDVTGKTVARSVALVPQSLEKDQTAPFRVKLPLRVAPGTKLRFTYKYSGMDGGSDGAGAVEWMQSFNAQVPDRQ